MRQNPTFGKRRVVVVAIAEDHGLMALLERAGLASAFGISTLVFAALLAANWLMG